MISLCMIVRNEEKFLANCLESVNGCVGEIVIVDTGSTDRTIEIADSFGARIYHHPWENDFSKHRNQSIGYAQGDWILWIDADETLEPGGGDVIRDAVRREGIDSLLVTMVCYFANRTRESHNSAIKLFRNNGGISFSGIVHNQVVGCKQTAICPAKIFHYGYDLDQEQVRKKFERTGSLLKKAIEDDPDNFRHHHDLAVAFTSVHLFQKAIDQGLTAIELHRKRNRQDPIILWTYFVVASSYFNLDRFDTAQEYATEAIKLNGDHFDAYFVLASIHARRQNMEGFEQARQDFVWLVEKYRQNPVSLAGFVVNKVGEKWRLDLDYGALLLNHGLVDEAKKYFTLAAQQCAESSSAYELAAAMCRQQGHFVLSERYVENALKAGLPSQNAEFERALIKKAAGDHVGYRSLMEGLLDAEQVGTPELMVALGTEAIRIGKFEQAEDLLTRAYESAYVHPRLYTSLALACKYQDKIDEAVLWNQRALEVDEKDLDALTNLGHLFYDLKDWRSAETYYKRTLAMDGHQRDVLFRLSFLALINQDFDACITFCDRLMGELNLPRERVIAKMEDIAQIYDEIARSFSRSGEMQLHLEALTLSKALRGQ